MSVSGTASYYFTTLWTHAALIELPTIRHTIHVAAFARVPVPLLLIHAQLPLHRLQYLLFLFDRNQVQRNLLHCIQRFFQLFIHLFGKRGFRQHPLDQRNLGGTLRFSILESGIRFHRVVVYVPLKAKQFGVDEVHLEIGDTEILLFDGTQEIVHFYREFFPQGVACDFGEVFGYQFGGR